VVAVGDSDLNIEGFRCWATGNLVDNRNRGIFAEWMVGQALGVVDDGDIRVEWDAVDLRYGKFTVEVKASGYSQTWNPENPTKPVYSIPQQKWAWDAAFGTSKQLDGRSRKHRRSGWWLEYDPPQRTADVYVFCLHESVPATNDNVTDPGTWSFRILSTSAVDKELGSQKTVGLSRLDRLTTPVSWAGIKPAIDQIFAGSGAAK